MHSNTCSLIVNSDSNTCTVNATTYMRLVVPVFEHDSPAQEGFLERDRHVALGGGGVSDVVG